MELAVFHQWGGATSRERAEVLVKEIIGMFLGPERIYKDDVSLILEDYLETHFSTICEDDSPDELGEIFCDMWRQCCTSGSESALVTNALAREYMRHEHEVLRRSEGLVAGDVDDGSDDGEMDAENAMESIQEGMEGAEQDEEEEESVPMVDPDGWETVARGKKVSGKKKGSSYKI